MLYRFLLALIALCVSSIAAHATTDGASYQPLSAQYRVTKIDEDRHSDVTEWQFARNGQQVQMGQGEYAEVWQRDERGALTLTRVFHHDKKMIQYTPGELKTQRRLKDWNSLNGFFDPRRQAGLQKAGETTFMGRPATRYSGKIGRENVEVIWLEKEAMLARYAIAGRDGSLTYELVDMRPMPLAATAGDALARAEQYDFIDGSDLGDMEYDPFVQSVLGEEHGHGSHGHQH